MAARRSSSSRSSGRRPSRAAQSNNNVPIIIGTGVVIVAILVVVAMNMGGEKPAPADVQQQGEPAKQAPAPETAKDTGASGKPRRQLKDPDVPAPKLAEGFLAGADALYTKAKKMHDDARRAQNAGEEAQFNKLINDSWDTMQELDTFIAKYTDWLEEADMGDWRVPSEYAALQSRMSKWDKLKGGIKRVKPNRR